MLENDIWLIFGQKISKTHKLPNYPQFYLINYAKCLEFSAAHCHNKSAYQILSLLLKDILEKK